MEPATTLGVAGDVTQFVEFAQKLIARTLHLYKSADGVSRDNRALESALRDFLLLKSKFVRGGENTQAGKFEVELNAKGVDRVIQRLVGHVEILAAHGDASSSVSGKSAVQSLSADCGCIAKNLLIRVEKVKAEESGRSWRSLKGALAGLWREPDLAEMLRKLELHQNQLEWQVMILLRESTNLLLPRQTDQFDPLQNSMRRQLFELIQQGEFNPDSAGASQSPTSERGIQARDQHEQKKAQVAKSILDALESRGLGKSPAVALSNPVAISDLVVRLTRRLQSAEWEVLESLRFSVLRDRQEAITDVELSTFDWIYREPRTTDLPWDNFSDWLLRGNSLYWMKGKAGSGKSTLMKHLFWQSRTIQLLRVWSAGTPLIVAGFFFWDNGNHYQRTQEGLLRSLLRQCLAEHRELIPVVFPDLAHTNPNDLDSIWTTDRLKTAFTRLVEQGEVPIKICFFIDGLDEYGGDHKTITDAIKEIVENPYIKACVASRPGEVFDEAFNGFPGLLLQNLTSEDIKIYVKSTIDQHPAMRELQKYDPDLETRVASTIARKAAGVFLWVKLVVRLLLGNMGTYKDPSDLERHLEELPNDLEDLYWHMLKSIKSDFHLEEASRLLQIAHEARKPLTLLQLSYADMEDPDIAVCGEFNQFSAEDRRRMLKQTEEKVRSRCCGLLEVMKSASKDLIEYRTVQFIHQSVADFLYRSEARSYISEALHKQSFNPNVALMKSCLLEMKHLNTAFYPERQPGAILAHMWYRSAIPIIERFIEYAQRAEAETEKPHVALISELDRVARYLCSLYVQAEGRYNISSGLISPKLHWSERTLEGREIDPVQENGSLFSFAAKAGLLHFVLAALGREKQSAKITRPSSSQIKYALLLCDVLASDSEWIANRTNLQTRAVLHTARGFRISTITKPAFRRISGVDRVLGKKWSEKMNKSHQQRRSAVKSAHMFGADERREQSHPDDPNPPNPLEHGDLRRRRQSLRLSSLERPPTPRFTFTVFADDEVSTTSD